MAGKKLLVADDSLTIQKVIRLALSNEGYEIQAVSDGNDAVQQISLFRPDVVLIDVSLPGKSAFEVKRSINEHADLEEVRFVLMSSAFERVDEEQVSEVRFHGRLTKPFDPAHLRQVLSDVLAQITAKRMEPTSLLKRPTEDELRAPPALPQTLPPAPPPPPVTSLWEPGEEKTGPMAHEPPVLSKRGFPPRPPGSGGANVSHAASHPSPPPPAPAPPPLPPISVSADHEPEPESEPESDHTESDAPDSDIRHLTESTIRISGLDDFQWSVQEPSLRPPTGLADQGNSTFEIEAPSSMDSQIIPPFRPERAEIVELGTAAPRKAPPAPQPPQLPVEEKITLDPPSYVGSRYDSAPEFDENEHEDRADGAGLNGSMVPAEHVATLVREQVEKSLEEMVQKMIPDLAERLIRQEIHRMLSEQS